MPRPLPRTSFLERACRTLLSLSLFLPVLAVASDALAHRVNVFAWVDGSALRIESSFGGGTKVNNGLVEVRDAQTGKILATTRTSGDGTAAVTITQRLLDAEDGLVVLLNAGEGHQNTWPVSREELAAGNAGKAGKPASTTDFEPSCTDDAQTAAGEAGVVAANKAWTETDSAGKDSGNVVHAIESLATDSLAFDRGASPQAGKQQNGGQQAARNERQDAGLLVQMSEEELAKLVDERLEAKIAPLRHMLAERVLGGPKLSDIVGGIGWILGLFGIWALTRRRI